MTMLCIQLSGNNNPKAACTLQTQFLEVFLVVFYRYIEMTCLSMQI